MKKSDIGIAIIGTGYWGKNLIRNYRDIGVLKLLCDNNEETLTQYNEQYPELKTCLALSDVLIRNDIQAVVIALSEGKAKLDAKFCQLVKLYRGGTPVKMSKRSGQFVTLREVVDEVGAGVLRFIMLTRKNEAPLDFDFEKVKEQSRENPVFYVQYAHARSHSVFKKAAEIMPALATGLDDLEAADFSRLVDPAEIDLVRTLAAWPRSVEAAAEAHEPHRIAFYLYNLASEFHALWNKGNDDPDLRFVIEGDEALTLARLALVRALALVIAEGLEVLGVEPLKEMH